MACTACKAPKTSSDNDKVIDELTAILKETKSPETFLVTAVTLGRMGPEAKRAIPVIIRNAERLEMFEDLLETKAPAGSRAAEEVMAAIEMILDKKAGAKERIWQNRTPAACCTPATPYAAYTPGMAPPPPSSTLPPAPSGSLVPAPGWNAPTVVPAPPQPPQPTPADKPPSVICN
jgi:hypothetical protein